MVVREAVSRRQVTLLPSLHGLPSPAGPVHRNTVGRPSTRSLGVMVQEVWMPAVPSSPCPRPRPASGVQCPVPATSVHACLSTRPVSSVRCGRLSVQVSAGRSPVFGVRSPVGVRCPCVPASAVSGRNEVRERGGGQAAARLGWPGSAWSPPVSTTGSSSAELERGAQAGAGCAGPAAMSAWLGRRRERWWQWPGRPRG
jgi:hypothetical protein